MGNHFWLVIVAVIFAAISAYYYFRVIQAMYFKEPATEETPHQMACQHSSFKIMLVITAILIILIGIIS